MTLHNETRSLGINYLSYDHVEKTRWNDISTAKVVSNYGLPYKDHNFKFPYSEMSSDKYPIPVIRIPINKGEWINDVLLKKGYNGIPTNTIVNKTETGLGATTCELFYTKANSIIILPNVPVIECKCEHNLTFLPIYAKTSVSQIKRYLQREDIPFKKLVSTPEGYAKIEKATKELKIDIYSTYRCLIDECEKIVQDSGFREKISYPMRSFFNFKVKAWVTATPLPMKSDMFQKHGFCWMVIEPTYDYKKDATLIVTRSFLESTINRIKILMPSSEHIVIFYKSTQGIKKLVQALINRGIITEKDYQVFCADQSVEKLIEERIMNTRSDLKFPLPKISFFTGRFFSALDINLDRKCDILALSNIFEAKHSIIDPFTEAVQLQGRFRKIFKDGKRYSSLTFITNTTPNIGGLSEEEVSNRISILERNYALIKAEASNAMNNAERDFILQDLKKLGYNDLQYEDGEFNPFAVECLYNTERVKQHYRSPKALIEAYQQTKHFNIKLIEEYVHLGEDDKNEFSNTDKIADKWEIIIGHLERFKSMKASGLCTDSDHAKGINDLKSLCPKDSFIFEAYDLIGKQGIRRNDYKKSLIEKDMKATKLQLSNAMRFDRSICRAIEEEFKNEVLLGRLIPKEEFMKRLGDIYTAYGISFTTYGCKATSSILCSITQSTVFDYFDASPQNKTKPASYRLKSFKQELIQNTEEE
ncbi:MAG: hypothetical protein RSE51_09750 [Bacteroidales bacterium]